MTEPATWVRAGAYRVEASGSTLVEKQSPGGKQYRGASLSVCL